MPVKVPTPPVSIIFLQLPNLNAGFWIHPVNIPAFFRTGEYRTKFHEGETVLALPYGKGDSMLWQVHSGMDFALPEGWTGPVPHSFQALPIVRAFQHNAAVADLGGQLRAFLTTHHVATILIDPAFPQAQFWVTQLQALGARSKQRVALFCSGCRRAIPSYQRLDGWLGSSLDGCSAAIAPSAIDWRSKTITSRRIKLSALTGSSSWRGNGK